MKAINLDNGAATPVAASVLEAMMPYFREYYGNPSSGHDLGKMPENALTEAREKVAELIGSSPGEVTFTSCASESNNLALKGIATAHKKKGKHIITSAIEHFSVLNPLKTLEKEGYSVTYLPVDNYGLIDPEQLQEAISSETVLVSIMTANPEIGTIQPVEEMAQIAKDKGVVFHTDATAAAGFIPLDVKKLKVDLLSLAGDQFYGPKGSGALFVRRGVRFLPLIEGGIQEGGRRAGCENVPAIVGLGEAALLARETMDQRAENLRAIRDSLREQLFSSINHLHLNGHPERRLPHNLHISVEFVEGEALLMHLNNAGIYVSSGSTCTSQALKASHVLEAIGLSPELAQGSLLFTLGLENNMEDVPYIVENLAETAEKLRKMSPLYQKYLKEGS